MHGGPLELHEFPESVMVPAQQPEAPPGREAQSAPPQEPQDGMQHAFPVFAKIPELQLGSAKSKHNGQVNLIAGE
jgi:hypothetical protein